MEKSRTLVATAAGALTLTIVSPPQGPPVAGPADGVDVTNVSRVGIRMYISVGASGATAADFAIESVTAERSADGVPSVTLWCAKPARPNCGRGHSRRSWEPHCRSVHQSQSASCSTERCPPDRGRRRVVSHHHLQVRNGVEPVRLGGSTLRVGVLSI